MVYNEIKDMLQELPGGCAVIRGGEVWEVICANDEFFVPSGYTENEVKDMPNDVYDIVHKGDVGSLRQVAEEALHSGEMRECQFRVYDKQGKIHWLATKMKFYCYKDRFPCYFVCIWDIHKRKQMEEELFLQTERYKLLEEINQGVPFEYDIKNQTFLLPKNQNISIKTGNSEKNILQLEELKKWIYPQDMGKVEAAIQEAALQPVESCLEYRMNPSGEEGEECFEWYRTNYKSLMGVNGMVVRVLGRTENITAQKSRQDEMVRQLKKDSMTGLLNKGAVRAAVEEFLKLEPDGEHAFFLIDVDNFKVINDTFGHLFGDSVLVNVAEKIAGLFRGSDIVGRIGGDEFVAFMKHATKIQARAKAQSICDAVNQEYNGMEEQVEISCSVGVAFCQAGEGDYNRLFSQADMAMYQAKKEGKNRYRVAELPDPKWQVQREKKSESRHSQYMAAKKQDRDFLTQAFLLLSHAKDVNNSLNLLTERIARQYDLGVVAVLECDFEKKEVCRLNSWSRAEGILPKQKFSEERPKWKLIQNMMEKQEMVCINDCQNENELEPEEQEIFQENGIHAMITGSFSFFERGRGYVMFCDMEKKREWQEEERDIFQEMVKLLSVFVAVRHQQEDEQHTIRKLKKRDALTGLYNEEAFKTEVRKAVKDWDEQQQYAIIYTDINDFSYVNDNYGQEAGNHVLKSLASRLASNPNAISCRLYSDLFICFVWDRDKESILQQVLKDNMEFNSRQRRKYQENIKLSTGIYFMESPFEELDIAIENANLARKSVKGNSGIFCRVYEKKLRQQRDKEKRIIEEFQKNLEEERFQVYIQPQFQLKQRTCIGGEALVRWKTKKGKMIYPDEFIPALEKSGDIIELDFFVYEQVLKALKKWQDQGKILPVISVNFSRKHFESGGIYFKILEGAELYDIPPSCIEIEITESLFTTGYDMVKTELRKLQVAGFKVAIDDFGTGYSSLSMLMDIPADVVKIDKSFLSMGNNKRGWQFIENMGQLIHSTKEKVIVEGIEKEEQFEFLKNSGFEYGQGYLFERPIPLPVFEEKYIK